MNAQQKSIAQECLDGSYSNTMSFPKSIGILMEAGFESYQVDYRLNTRTYYLPNGQTLVLKNPHDHGPVAAAFNQAEVAAAIKWAQLNPPDYTYNDFCRKVCANGCAGYIVSILGKRVVYFGRTAEIHIEYFPQ